MSLLLDALKKAADDKEKKSQAESPSLKESEVVASEQAQSVSEKKLNSVVDVASIDEHDTGELSLDEISPQSDDQIAEVPPNQENEEDLSLEKQAEPENESPQLSQSNQKISDDGLSMLIYKTNHDVKKDKRVMLAGVFLFSLIVLLSGGIYYYLDMETEIEALERKHKIAMQSMRSKTNREKPPAKSEIIRNLVSDAELEAKVEYAKQRLEDAEKEEQVEPAVAAPARKKSTKRPASILALEKTNKEDSVGEKLDAAWLAYESGNLLQAKQAYKDVLVSEKDNRDALLGLGAIAVVEKNRLSAREIYLKLLKLDPRDPIATAAIASLHTDKSSLGTDESYLVSMLKSNPDAAHLNFALGNVYAQQNKWTAAQQKYFKAWQQDSENADYIFNLAVSMDQLSKQQQAVNFYKDSLVKAENKQVSFSREAVKNRINELTGL